MNDAATVVPPARPVIVVAGNPNTGKSTVFNALCGTRQRVGNYPGVTVEKKIGLARLPGTGSVDVVDLPGLYSLGAVSPDEQIAADVLMGRVPVSEDRRRTEAVHRPDLVLFVLDATNLRRNLFLFTQIAELDLPVVVALTMTDLLGGARMNVNVTALRERLGVPVVPVIGRRREHLENLREELAAALEPEQGMSPRLALDFPSDMETIVTELREGVASQGIRLSGFEARNLLLNPRHPLAERVASTAAGVLDDTRAKVHSLNFNPASLALARYQWIEGVLGGVEQREKKQDGEDRSSSDFSSRLDSLLTHRVLGLAAFSGVMYLVFQSIYTWATPFMDLIDEAFGSMSGLAGAYLTAAPMLQSLVSDGLIAGVGSVVIFLPQILILFLFIAFLEDSGYLARAAFLMDRLLGWTGLNGRAFIPMLSSFACAIPGIMAARVMPDPRARLSTILVAPLMSCSARLPVYLLMISAFIEPHFGAGIAALTLFIMYGIGPLVALPFAWFLNRGVLKTPAIPFVLELPPYRWPDPLNVLWRALEAAKKFLVRAGTIIFAMSIIIWAMSYFPRPDSVAENIHSRYDPMIAAAESELVPVELAEAPEDADFSSDDVSVVEELRAERDNAIASAYLEQSYLGRLGKTVQPIFAPLGFDWKISVGILGAFPAREVIIATLGIIYNAGDAVDEESADLKSRMAAETHPDGTPVYTPLVALTLMVFFALCSQCMSTLATVWRELNDWRWAAFLFVYMTVFAYIAGLAVYQAGRALGYQ